MSHRPHARRGGLPRRRHRLAQPRAARPPPGRLLHRRPRLAQRHLRQPPPDRVAPARRRRRDPDRQVQAQLPGALRMADGDAQARHAETPARARERRFAPAQGADDRRRRKILGQEFDDISISKIRYLEDQKLLAPRRTPGGYRLYSQADVERLRAILRMQRDEFLPLRVIRQELAAGDGRRRAPPGGDVGHEAPRDDASTSQVQTIERGRAARADRRQRRASCASSSEFGVVQPERRDGAPALRRDRPRDRPRRGRAGALRRRRAQPARLPHAPPTARRRCSSSSWAPSLRSRSPARRQEAVENLESLAAVCSHLKHLLLVRDLRRLKRRRGLMPHRSGPADARRSPARARSRRRRTRLGAGLRSAQPAALVARMRPGRGRRRADGRARALDRRPRDEHGQRRPRRLSAASAPTDGERYVWEQELDGHAVRAHPARSRALELDARAGGAERDRACSSQATSACAASRGSARR